MECSICGGSVIWMGPMSNLTHTECMNCGETNSQIVDPEIDEDDPFADDNETIWEDPDMGAR